MKHLYPFFLLFTALVLNAHSATVVPTLKDVSATGTTYKFSATLNSPLRLLQN